MENVLHAGPSGLHIFINDYDRCTIPKKNYNKKYSCNEK